MLQGRDSPSALSSIRVFQSEKFKLKTEIAKLGEFRPRPVQWFWFCVSHFEVSRLGALINHVTQGVEGSF